MLRDVNHVKGFRIHATDGEFGRLDDFVVDDDSWTIRYLGGYPALGDRQKSACLSGLDSES